MAYTTTGAVYVSNQPGTGNPFDQFNNTWSVGLCECCNDVSQCCYAYWCWCCFVYSLADKIDESCCSCWCVPNVLGYYRMKVRSVLKIKGDSCGDSCATIWCPCCAALQMVNEVNSRREVKQFQVINQIAENSY